MKNKTILSSVVGTTLPTIFLLGAGTGLWACSAEFKDRCPDGTTQTAGGGDVSQACTPNDQLNGGGGAPGGGGAGGSGPAMGGGGSGNAGVGGSGGTGPIPPGADCSPAATKCESDAQQTCGADGKWGASQACDIECDGAGSKCVMPVQLAAGADHACALLSDGTARCWGHNVVGQIGDSTTSNAFKPQRVVNLQGATTIVAGARNSCAIAGDKSAFCWGANEQGQFGGGAHPAVQPIKLPLQNVLAISAGAQNPTISDGRGNVCAIVESGDSNVLKCAGDNEYGQNGTGAASVQPIKSFVNVTGLPAGATSISVGGAYACAIDKNEAVFCWGQNPVDNVGNGEANASAPVLNPFHVSQVGGARAVSASSVFTGSDDINTCAIKKDGVAYCWGKNAHGQLGRGTKDASGGKPPGVVKDLGDVKQIAVGGSFACALKNDGTLWCWGANQGGQLGTASTQDVASPVQVNTPSLTEIAVGSNGSASSFACGLAADGKVLCWGKNDVGQLGIGQAIQSTSTPTPVAWK